MITIRLLWSKVLSKSVPWAVSERKERLAAAVLQEFLQRSANSGDEFNSKLMSLSSALAYSYRVRVRSSNCSSIYRSRLTSLFNAIKFLACSFHCIAPHFPLQTFNDIGRSGLTFVRNPFKIFNYLNHKR